jgi:hypothetical protein
MTVRGVVGANAMLAAARTIAGGDAGGRTERERGGAGCLDGTRGSGWRPRRSLKALWRTLVLLCTVQAHRE